MFAHRQICFQLLFQISLISLLIFLTTLTAPVSATTTRTTNNCHNETRQITVNETVEEWCAGIGVYCYWDNSCYCNVSKMVTKDHVTVVCEELTLVDGDDEAEAGSILGGRKLTDPEVAAIAVIASLVFSILLSLAVFFIQRRHSRGCLAKKDSNAQIVQVERGQSSDSQQGDEADKFLPPAHKSYPSKTASGSTDRYITVTPANKETNLYEDVQPGGGKTSYKPDRESLLKERPQSKVSQYMDMSGRKSANSGTAPSVNSNRHSTNSSTQTERCATPKSAMRDSNTNPHYENVTDDNKKPEPESATEKSEAVTKSVSTNSLKLNISEDDLYEETQTSQILQRVVQHFNANCKNVESDEQLGALADSDS